MILDSNKAQISIFNIFLPSSTNARGKVEVTLYLPKTSVLAEYANTNTCVRFSFGFGDFYHLVKPSQFPSVGDAMFNNVMRARCSLGKRNAAVCTNKAQEASEETT